MTEYMIPEDRLQLMLRVAVQLADVARMRQAVAEGALRVGRADIAADLLGTAGPMAADAAEAIGFIQGLLAQRGA